MSVMLPVYLFVFLKEAKYRKHFAIFIPHQDSMMYSPSDRKNWKGLLLHVKGDALHGYVHEFLRGFPPNLSPTLIRSVHLGQVPLHTIPMEGSHPASTRIGDIFLNVPAPKGVMDVSAPASLGRNARCQEWTMLFLRKLAEEGLLPVEATIEADSHRDDPNHGLGEVLADHIPKNLIDEAGTSDEESRRA